MKALSENINYMNNTFECFFFYQKHSPKVNLRRSHWSGPRDADLLAVMIVLSRLASIFFLQSTPSPFLAYFVSCSIHPIHDPRIIIIFAQFPMMIYEPDCYDLFWWLYEKKIKLFGVSLQIYNWENDHVVANHGCNHSCRFFTYHTYNGRSSMCAIYPSNFMDF